MYACKYVYTYVVSYIVQAYVCSYECMYIFVNQISLKSNLYDNNHETRPVKTGHICTLILHHFSNFNLMLLHIYCAI